MASRCDNHGSGRKVDVVENIAVAQLSNDGIFDFGVVVLEQSAHQALFHVEPFVAGFEVSAFP